MNIKQVIRKAKHCFAKLWSRPVDSRLISELAGERVAFNHLKSQGFLEGFEKKRILEIGPKHGKDSLLLATLNPSELVLVDLPSKASRVRKWLPQVSCQCKTVFLEGNILYLTQGQYRRLGRFDLIWCLGVLYHNVEQLRLLKRLFDLCKVNGRLVVESATTRNRKLEKLSVVEIHWPSTYRNVQTMTHLPSRLAIKAWLEMVGFTQVKIWDIYSKECGWQRAVLSGKRTSKSRPYISYKSGLNPIYLAGKAK